MKEMFQDMEVLDHFVEDLLQPGASPKLFHRRFGTKKTPALLVGVRCLEAAQAVHPGAKSSLPEGFGMYWLGHGQARLVILRPDHTEDVRVARRYFDGRERDEDDEPMSISGVLAGQKRGVITSASRSRLFEYGLVPGDAVAVTVNHLNAFGFVSRVDRLRLRIAFADRPVVEAAARAAKAYWDAKLAEAEEYCGGLER